MIVFVISLPNSQTKLILSPGNSVFSEGRAVFRLAQGASCRDRFGLLEGGWFGGRRCLSNGGIWHEVHGRERRS